VAYLVMIIVMPIANVATISNITWLVIIYCFPQSRSETFRVVSWEQFRKAGLLRRVVLFQFIVPTSLYHECVEEYRHLMANVAP